RVGLLLVGALTLSRRLRLGGLDRSKSMSPSELSLSAEPGELSEEGRKSMRSWATISSSSTKTSSPSAATSAMEENEMSSPSSNGQNVTQGREENQVRECLGGGLLPFRPRPSWRGGARAGVAVLAKVVSSFARIARRRVKIMP